MTNEFQKMQDHTAFQRVASFTIIHPKKKGYAIVNVAYPAPGHGERPLSVFVIDAFGDTRTCQMGKAGGYGYDKLTAALSGLVIDGHTLADHSHTDKTCKILVKRAKGKTYDECRAILKRYPGYSFANWGFRDDGEGPSSCYKEPGLDYLRALGYSVIQAI